jgi:hypothetical protein
LRGERECGFEHFITGDESWLFLHDPNESIWAESRDEFPVRVKQMIDAQKCLISVLWSVNGIHSLFDVPRGESCNSAFYCHVVVSTLIEDICSRSHPRSLKGVCVHLDNANPTVF